MDKEISVGAIVFRKFEDKFKFLILKRNDNSIWEFPKGHAEKEESEFNTLKREINEELGIKDYTLIQNFREKISYISSRKIIREFIFYLVSSNEAIKISEEHREYEWITIEEAPAYFEHKDIVVLLKKAEKKIHEGI